MTYYKYAEREANSQINWAQISKGLSDTITQIDKDRQAKKAAIDESTREAMLQLADGPKGENTTASEWTIKYANDMMNYRLTIDRLLKSGQMSLKDYQVAAQNSKDSTNLLFTIAQEYQDEYKTIMDRKKTTESSVWEAEMAAHNESLANLASTTPYINSTNGMVFLSNPKTGPDGVEQMGDNYVSLQALRNRIKFKIDRYDLSGNIKEQTDKLGKYSIDQLGRTNFRRTGVITDIDDPTLRKTYEDWENATIDQIMSNHYSWASVMGDYMVKNPRTGNQYRMTLDKKEFEADKTGDVILMENQNGSGIIMPQFTEDQSKDVKNFLKGQIKNYIDQTSEKDVFQEPEPYRPQQWEVEAGKAAKESSNAQDLWQGLYTARTIAEKNAAKAALLGLDIVKEAGIDDIRWIDNDNIEIIYANPENNRPISLVDASGNRMSGLDWAKAGTEFTGIKDLNKLKKYSKTVEGGVQLDKTQMAPGRQGRNENYYNFVASLKDQPVKDLIDADDAEETADALNAAYSQYGLSFDYDEGGFTDNIIIKYKGKKVGNPIPVDEQAAGAASIRGAIEGILKNAPAAEAKEKAAAKKGSSPIAASGGGTVKGGNVR